MPKFLSREEYAKIKGEGIMGIDNCPFCDKEKRSSEILREGKYRYILYNHFPYSGNEQHIMAVPYEHKKHSHELSEDELLEIKDIHNFVKNFFGDDQYFSFTRESMGGRTVEHLHIHFLVGILEIKLLSEC